MPRWAVVTPLAGFRTSMPGSGFTLVELVMVVALLALVSAVAISRLASSDAFESRGFYDQSMSAVRYAARVATARRSAVSVVVTESELRVCFDPACNRVVLHPGSGEPLALAAPSGVTLGGAGFAFSPSGQPPDTGATISINDGTVTRTIVVEPVTGYVHE